MKLEIMIEDRLGMVLDILNTLYKNNIDIESLEVFSRKIYMKININSYYCNNILFKNIKNIKGVKEVKKYIYYLMKKTKKINYYN